MIRRVAIAIALATALANLLWLAFAGDHPAGQAQVMAEQEQSNGPGHGDRLEPAGPPPGLDAAPSQELDQDQPLETWIGTLEGKSLRQSRGSGYTYRARAEWSIYAKSGILLTLVRTDAGDPAPVYNVVVPTASVGPHLSFEANIRLTDILDTTAICGTLRDGRFEGPALSAYLAPVDRGYDYRIDTGSITLQLADGGGQGILFAGTPATEGTDEDEPASAQVADFIGEWTGPFSMTTDNLAGKVTENLNVKLSIASLGQGQAGGTLSLAPTADNGAEPSEYQLSQVKLSGADLSFVATPKSGNAYEAYAFAGSVHHGMLEGTVVRLYVESDGDTRVTYLFSNGILSLARQ